MNVRSPLARLQRTRLEQLRLLGLCTDDSLVAAAAQAGETIDRTTIVRYRAGERTCPIGLLDLVLHHVDDPGAVLDLWARDHGLRVVPDGDIDTDERGLSDRGLEVAGLAGHVVEAIRSALADGRVERTESLNIARVAAELRRAAAELEAGAA